MAVNPTARPKPRASPAMKLVTSNRRGDPISCMKSTRLPRSRYRASASIFRLSEVTERRLTRLTIVSPRTILPAAPSFQTRGPATMVVEAGSAPKTRINDDNSELSVYFSRHNWIRAWKAGAAEPVGPYPDGSSIFAENVAEEGLRLVKEIPGQFYLRGF